MTNDYTVKLIKSGFKKQEVEGFSYDERDIDKRICDIVEADVEHARNKHRQMRPQREWWYQLYRGKTLGTEREGRSKFISRDVMTTIEWKMPQFMRYFSQNGRIVHTVPVGSDDTKDAELASALLNWQFFTGNKGFIPLYKWCKGAQILGNMVVKSTWVDEYEEFVETYRVMTQEQFDEFQARADAEDADVEILSYEKEEIDRIVISTNDYNEPYDTEPVYQYNDVVIKRLAYKYRGPKMTICNPEDLFVDPDALDLEDAQYVVHRVWKTLGELYADQDAGVYKNVDELEAKITEMDAEAESEKMVRAADSETVYGKFDNYVSDQKARRMVEIWEYWGNVDVMNNGRFVPWLAVVSNGVVLRSEPNPYMHGKPPFDDIRPNIDPFTYEGISASETIGPFEEAKSAMIRQTLDNMSFQNNQMWEAVRNVHPDLDALMNPRPGRIVLVDRTGGIKPLTPPPLQGSTIQMFEFLQTILEALTGQTRYNQGLDSSSLNRTATGITQIMARSDMRNWLEAELMANSGMQSMFEKWMSMNKQFLPDNYTFRLFGKVFNLSRSELYYHYDITIEVGKAIAEQESAVQQLMNMMQQMPSLMKMGVVTPDDAYNSYVELLKRWGFKDYDKFATNPEFVQKIKRQAEELQVIVKSLMDAGYITPEMIQQAIQQKQAQLQQGGAQDGRGATGQRTGSANENTVPTGGRNPRPPVPTGYQGI